MKEGDQSSVYLGNNSKPPDRSTSAPPVLSAESLFAFHAADHLQLFADIRCEDNYYDFYTKYQNQGGKGLPPPLEMMDRAYREEDDHMHPNSHASQQQHIQQLQQQIQQHQMQQQMQQFQQQQQHQQQHQQHPPQYQQLQHAHPHQQQMHSQHHPQHMPLQHPPHPPQPHLSHQQFQQLQQQMHHPQHPPQMHHQQHPQQMQLPPHPHQQHLQHMQHQQPHMPRGYNAEHRFSVPEIRNPPPRSTSNPYMRNAYSERFESVPEEPTHIHDDIVPSTSPSNETIWTPLPRKMANLVLGDDFPIAPSQDDMHKGPQQNAHGAHGHAQGRMNPGAHGHPAHGSQQRDPNLYYQQSDFDNVAYSTASALLKEDNIQSLWNDRGYDRQQRAPPHITAPTPTVASQSSLISLLGNGFFNEPTPADKLSSRRRASSGGRITIPSVIPPTSPPPHSQNQIGGGPGASSTSPALPICRYYQQGFCSRGERCNFLHDDQASQMHQLQQDRNVGDVQFVKPKAKKSNASPPPMNMGNMPPKVPSPVHRMPPQSGNGSGHIGNGNGNSQSNNSNLNSLLASISQMNLGPSNGHQGPIGPSGGPATSPQPIAPPRSTTPTSQSGNANGLDIAFASGGSTSPNGKSDLSRQYTSIEQVIGHIYSLCKDQHGCRFLQKKLEDRDPMVVEIIFNEVYDHMTELMIDPFGNYLCQKLLEHCNDEQRLHIIEKVAPDLVKISKNVHGTRAVQELIEYLLTPAQIAIAKKALSNHVVTLIQDLNGNHVIQRCLNRLSPQDNQFIYDSVSQAGHCVEVATHRHGCCVLQRCIDHASDSQKIQLINEIIANALVLVQDPYGNYVVQYVLDLPFPGLASRLARRFLGHIPILSTQKFSSNVVEKCLNVTDMQTRVSIIQELVEYDNLLYLLQDPYANYVIQTSLIVSEPVQHARLVEAIRPHLSALRNTPYGKRIQNKILKESSRDYYA